MVQIAFGLWAEAREPAQQRAAWRASVALHRQVLGLARAATGGARRLQAQLQDELHVASIIARHITGDARALAHAWPKRKIAVYKFRQVP